LGLSVLAKGPSIPFRAKPFEDEVVSQILGVRLRDEGASLLVMADSSSNPEEMIAQGLVACLVNIIAAADNDAASFGGHRICEPACVYNGSHDSTMLTETKTTTCVLCPMLQGIASWGVKLYS
jgi:hypothetical protein